MVWFQAGSPRAVRGYRASRSCALSAGAQRQIGYELPTRNRGIIEVGPLRWEKSDALGLVRRQHSLAGLELLYVHPRTHEFLLSAALRAQRWDSSTSDAAPDGTITFHTLREYVPGDDLRFIHWRSSAKLDTLMVRRNIDVSLPMTTILLVTGRGGYQSAELFEHAVEVAASTVVAAARERLPARLLTSGGQTVASAGGHDDAGRFLDFLAGVGLSEETGLSQAAERLERSESGGIPVVATGSIEADDLVTLAGSQPATTTWSWPCSGRSSNPRPVPPPRTPSRPTWR